MTTGRAPSILFGGTFDPVHDAHLEVARAAARRTHARRVVFIPAANPPHKSSGAHASYDDRVRMLELACEGMDDFEVSRIEEGPARSYSILTVEKFLRPGAESLVFLIGADAFALIQTWYRWRDLVELVEFIIVARPGAAYEIPPGARVMEIPGLVTPVSSSEIRLRLMRGDDAVPVPPAVLRWIRERGIYRSQEL